MLYMLSVFCFYLCECWAVMLRVLCMLLQRVVCCYLGWAVMLRMQSLCCGSSVVTWNGLSCLKCNACNCVFCVTFVNAGVPYFDEYYASRASSVPFVSSRAGPPYLECHACWWYSLLPLWVLGRHAWNAMRADGILYYLCERWAPYLESCMLMVFYITFVSAGPPCLECHACWASSVRGWAACPPSGPAAGGSSDRIRLVNKENKLAG